MARRRVRPRRHHHRVGDAVGVAGHRAQRAALSRRHAMHRAASAATAPSPARSSTSRAAATSRHDYYGVDTTPLFVMLAGAYYTRTADLDFDGRVVAGDYLRVRWIDVYGDVDGDGFIERPPPRSGPRATWLEELAGCGVPRRWPAGHRAAGVVRSAGLRVCRAARRRAHRPVARRDAARHRAGRGRAGAAGPVQHGFLVQGHRDLRAALDGDKQPCRVRTSNPGHCLFTGIAHAGARAPGHRGTRDEHFSRAGACGRWPRANCATTRCRITTVRSGRMTTR